VKTRASEHGNQSRGERIRGRVSVERGLNSNLLDDPRDTTTPEAMIATMQKILIGNALPSEAREILIGWLKNCRSGLRRLRAGLPQAWVIGDKRGTGPRGAANDIAVAWPPRRPPLLIASYVSDSGAAPDALDAAHARIGGIVAAAFS